MSDTVTAANRIFWDELCGSRMARDLGIVDDSQESLSRFDRYYMATYPYLEDYIKLETLRPHRVLEVGLGYGTVAQRLALASAAYVGLDVAAGPVAMVNHRLQLHGLEATAIVGSILDCPFEDHAFDRVVSIGCLHHTGDLQRALSEVRRVLRPGGAALVMVYSTFSYRQWLRRPVRTGRRLVAQLRGREAAVEPTSAERAEYDESTAGAAAPETVFTSVRQLRQLLSPKWSHVRIRRENAARESLLRIFPRSVLLKTVGRSAGLDLYCELVK